MIRKDNVIIFRYLCSIYVSINLTPESKFKCNSIKGDPTSSFCSKSIQVMELWLYRMRSKFLALASIDVVFHASSIYWNTRQQVSKYFFHYDIPCSPFSALIIFTFFCHCFMELMAKKLSILVFYFYYIDFPYM